MSRVTSDKALLDDIHEVFKSEDSGSRRSCCSTEASTSLSRYYLICFSPRIMRKP